MDNFSLNFKSNDMDIVTFQKGTIMQEKMKSIKGLLDEWNDDITTPYTWNNWCAKEFPEIHKKLTKYICELLNAESKDLRQQFKEL